jgi:DNA-binding NtrC family response regulator
LATFFLNKFATAMGKQIEGICEVGMNQLARHSWPGNIRQLVNVIERAVVMAEVL